MRTTGNAEWDAFAWSRPVIRGIGVVMATPLDEQGAVIEDEFRRHLRWLIESGVGYVQPSAATGQVMQTGDEEYTRLLQIAVEECEGTETLVTAYPGRADTAHTIELTRRAQEIGVDAYFLVQPLFTKPDERGMHAHYRAVIDAAPGFPVVLYNNPDRTSISLTLDVIGRLANECDDVVGLKQADPAVLVEAALRPSQVATNRRDVTQTDAARLFDAHPDAAGLRWWSTLEASWINATLFDRAARRVHVRAVHALDPGAEDVRAAAAFLGLGPL